MESCRGSYEDGLPKASMPMVYSLSWSASPANDFPDRYESNLRSDSALQNASLSNIW